MLDLRKCFDNHLCEKREVEMQSQLRGSQAHHFAGLSFCGGNRLKDEFMDALTLVKLADDGTSLVLNWSDGVSQQIPWATLRKECPCAVCNVEREQPPAKVNPLAVIDVVQTRPIRPTGLRPVGNYAYAISFSDGHNSGIFSLATLRRIGEASAGSVPR